MFSIAPILPPSKNTIRPVLISFTQIINKQGASACETVIQSTRQFELQALNKITDVGLGMDSIKQ